MPRHPRIAPAGHFYHVLNRSAARFKMFRTPNDFLAFQRILLETHQRTPLPILSYCIMPNHWHFIVHPNTDTQITDFFRWLSHTHAMRWRVAHNTVGYGPLYQGRFKSFPIQKEGGLLALCRYVERNPLASKIVKQAQDYPWSSLHTRLHKNPDMLPLLTDWPSPPSPAYWLQLVNRPLTLKELAKIQLSIQRSSPFGTDPWIASTAASLNLQHTLRPEGRPKLQPK